MEKKHLRKSITVKLVGGLGNQLFGYFAGLELSKSRNLDLNFDVTDVRHKFGVHDVSIESLTLQGNFVSKKISNKLVYKIFNKLSKLVKKNSFFSKNYFSDVIGYDPKIYALPTGSHLNGYFQTYVHFWKIRDSLDKISLKNPSDWFKIKSAEIERTDVLAIHVRRGDYEKLSNDYGLLSENYYRKAIELFQHAYPIQKIWIFSDDISVAKKILCKHVPRDSVWVDPKDVEDDAEALILMSKAKSFIIANSTFSWWAAALGNPLSKVVAPKKWYRNMQDPNELIPPEWITVESDWEN
jgi:hypothetical protein